MPPSPSISIRKRPIRPRFRPPAAPRFPIKDAPPTRSLWDKISIQNTTELHTQLNFLYFQQPIAFQIWASDCGS